MAGAEARGRALNLSPRALGIGVAVGVVASVSNLYVSLRTGWSLPVMTTAALVGFAATTRPGSKDRLGAGEATVLTACASAAGYMAGGGNTAALPALAMAGERAPPLVMVALAWIAIAAAGTLLAPLLRHGTIDGAALRFPTATATVSVTEALSAAGADAPRAETRPLTFAAFAAGGVSLGRNILGVSQTIGAPGRIGATPLADLTFGVDPSFALAGIGALMTVRTAVSTLVAGVVTYGIAAPRLVQAGVIADASYRAIVGFMVWPSAALLVTSALLGIALDLPKLLRGDRARGGVAGDRRGAGRFLLALVIASLILTTLLHVPLSAVLLAAPIAVILAFVAGRAIGETDIVPTKALTPIAQLVLGAFGAPLVTTTLAPNLTSGVALHAADTLASLKVANATRTPEHQVVVARLLGCAAGGVAVAVAYALVVGDASSLPSAELPVPGVLVWKSVAVASTEGVGSLSAPVRLAIAVGAVFGLVLALLERVLPARLVAWLPSPMGLGSGIVLPVSNAVTIALGALCRAALARRDPSRERFVVPVASGLVAGESVVGIAWQAYLAILHR